MSISHKKHGYHAILESQGAWSKMEMADLQILMESAAEVANVTPLQYSFHNFGDGFGKTGLMILAGGHITVSTWPKDNYAAFDIFMNHSKDQLQKAIDVIKNADTGGTIDCKIFSRGLPAPKLTIYTSASS